MRLIGSDLHIAWIPEYLIMRTEPFVPERRPPPPAVVRTVLASRKLRLRPTILSMNEANAAAAALGGCIGCLKGEKLAIGLVDEQDGHVVALAVCASASAWDLADPHTIEVRCLLVGRDRPISREALWSAIERKAGERGYRRLIMRGAHALPPAFPATGWDRALPCSLRHCDGTFAPGAFWSKVLRGEWR